MFSLGGEFAFIQIWSFESDCGEMMVMWMTLRRRQGWKVDRGNDHNEHEHRQIMIKMRWWDNDDGIMMEMICCWWADDRDEDRDNEMMMRSWWRWDDRWDYDEDLDTDGDVGGSHKNLFVLQCHHVLKTSHQGLLIAIAKDRTEVAPLHWYRHHVRIELNA